MVQAIPATEVTLRDLKQAFGIRLTQDPTFFREWTEPERALSEAEQRLLDRVKPVREL